MGEGLPLHKDKMKRPVLLGEGFVSLNAQIPAKDYKANKKYGPIEKQK